jgi:hypothetical protein
MVDKKDFKLEQTKGNFKLNGIIVGISKETTYIESETKDGKPYRSLRFGVKTSPINIINVELFGSVQDYVYAYSRTEGNTQKISFDNRNDELDDTYHLIGINVKTDANGERETYVDYDAVEVIYQGFNDGDNVYITGELKPNSFISSTTGELVSNFKYIIKSISANKAPLDFESSEFKEVCSFDHEIIITDTNFNKKDNKVIVNGYAIGYADSFKQVQFVIHYDKNKKLGDNFLKLKFGDYIKVLGVCINAPTNQPVEEDEWGSEIPQGYNTGGKYINELRITAVDRDKDMQSIYKKKKYKEEDFIQEENYENGESEEDLTDDLPF